MSPVVVAIKFPAVIRSARNFVPLSVTSARETLEFHEISGIISENLRISKHIIKTCRDNFSKCYAALIWYSSNSYGKECRKLSISFFSNLNEMNYSRILTTEWSLSGYKTVSTNTLYITIIYIIASKICKYFIAFNFCF